MPLKLFLLFFWVFFHFQTAQAEPLRIVSLAPSLTDLAAKFALEGSLVGRTRFCNYPESIKLLPSVGNLHEPNLEVLLQLQPTHILASDMTPAAVRQRLGRLGFEVLYFPQNSMSDIFDAARALDSLNPEPGSADAWIESIEKAMSAIMAEFVLPHPKALRFLFTYDLQHLSAAGPGSFPADMLSTIGLVNVADSELSPWPRLSREALLRNSPDIIFLTFKLPDGSPASGPRALQLLAEMETDSFWSQIKAVRDGRVFLVNPDPFTVPGTRFGDALASIRLALEATFPTP